MSNPSSFRVDLMQETVAWAEKLDDVGSKATIRLDDKSQQTGTVAGVFLAAALGFLKSDSLSSLSPHIRLFIGSVLFVGVIVLVCCVATCLSVVWLQFIPAPITLKVMQSLTEDIAGHDDADIDSDVKLAAYRERLKIWNPILEDRLRLNKVKALRLQVAQILLATGILLIAVLLSAVCRAIIAGAHT